MRRLGGGFLYEESEGGLDAKTQDDGLAAGGDYKGDGTDCATANCPQPTGACCFADGSCIEQTEAECDAGGGDYQGENVSCSAANCPRTTGACCLPGGTCQEVMQSDCEIAGGDYQGDDTLCNDVDCGGDRTPPDCELTSVDPGPPVVLTVTAHDPESGICQINVQIATNATVNIPPFTQGTTDPIVITAEKTNQSDGSQVQLEIVDCEGNKTVCDPVMVEFEVEAGVPFVRTIPDIPAAEVWVSVYNGTPGVDNLHVGVNQNRNYRLSALQDGEERSIEVSCAVLPGNHNSMTFSALRDTDARLTVLISDVLPASSVRATVFLRGDPNDDGKIDIADPTAILGYLFTGVVTLDCDDAVDTNNDGAMDISDAVQLLTHLFRGPSVNPAAPFPACGLDQGLDHLKCKEFNSCQ